MSFYKIPPATLFLPTTSSLQGKAGGGSDRKAHAMTNDFDWLLMPCSDGGLSAAKLLQSCCNVLLSLSLIRYLSAAIISTSHNARYKDLEPTLDYP